MQLKRISFTILGIALMASAFQNCSPVQQPGAQSPSLGALPDNLNIGQNDQSQLPQSKVLGAVDVKYADGSSRRYSVAESGEVSDTANGTDSIVIYVLSASAIAGLKADIAEFAKVEGQPEQLSLCDAAETRPDSVGRTVSVVTAQGSKDIHKETGCTGTDWTNNIVASRLNALLASVAVDTPRSLIKAFRASHTDQELSAVYQANQMIIRANSGASTEVDIYGDGSRRVGQVVDTRFKLSPYFTKVVSFFAARYTVKALAPSSQNPPLPPATSVPATPSASARVLYRLEVFTRSSQPTEIQRVISLFETPIFPYVYVGGQSPDGDAIRTLLIAL
jgi:hypothetical protein